MRRHVWISGWTLAAAPEAVWPVLTEVGDWPRWWRQLARVERLRAGDAAGVGAVTRFDWKSGAGYRVRIAMRTRRMLRPREIEGVAAGDVAGRGLWLLEAIDARHTRVTYRWEIELRRGWMRAAAVLLAPLFRHRHFALMRSGAAGMAAHLGCAMHDYRDWSAGRHATPGAAAPGS